MKIEKIIEGVVGLYLVLPGVEDVGSAGLTLAPSAIVGALLLADAFGVEL